MADREVTREEFISAYMTVALVKAKDMWRRFQENAATPKTSALDSTWLDSKAARRHVHFGETKFRELIKAGVLPEGTEIGGKLFWDKRELDRRMAKYLRRRRA
jgi:hypothetical protein